MLTTLLFVIYSTLIDNAKTPFSNLFAYFEMNAYNVV